MNELDQAKDIFLSPELDEETRSENEAMIREWEQTLIRSEAFDSWRKHDITQQIIIQARESYKDFAVQLSQDRKLTDEQRRSLWAKQDAALWLLSLTDKDAKSVIEQIHKEIRTALQAA